MGSFSPSAFKVNCDAAMKGNKIGITYVLLDGFSKRISYGSLVLVVEAVAIREVCIFSLKAGISEIFAHSDN